MKRLLYSILAIIACISSINAQNISIVNGVWERGVWQSMGGGAWGTTKPETVYLYAIENGVLHELASSQVGTNGEFVLAFFPQEEGFFAIGTSTRMAREIHLFYFKPGDNLKVKVTRENFELFGENTPENIEMERWYNFTKPMTDILFDRTDEGRNATHIDFFPLMVEKENNFPRANTPNEKFNSLFERYQEVDFLSLAIAFLHRPARRTLSIEDHPDFREDMSAEELSKLMSDIVSQSPAGPGIEDYPNFYRNISIENLTGDEFLLSFPGGMSLLSNAIRWKTNFGGQMEQMAQNPIDFLIQYPEIKSPVIKGELVLNIAHGNQTRAGLNAFQEQYGQYIVTDSQRERMRNLEIALFQNEAAAAAERVKAFDFTFPNVNGNQVSLSDFEGKVVYIDVWATWCGPCLSEIPALLKLKEEYKDNDNLIFMGVSVDAQRDKKKWEELLIEKGLSGVQLFAGDDAEREIMEPYGIMGIPRFILVGKDGTIFMSNAPRPSSGEIRAVLNEAVSR
jgi:thiol-disulfide isomerase/thioredoxin